MREIWREPSGYEGVVLVSNKGRVFKLPQKGGNGTGRYSRDGHLLKQTKINTGYWCVDMMQSILDDAPTIVPAEGDVNDGA